VYNNKTLANNKGERRRQQTTPPKKDIPFLKAFLCFATLLPAHYNTPQQHQHQQPKKKSHPDQLVLKFCRIASFSHHVLNPIPHKDFNEQVKVSHTPQSAS
jgi:hypothetical protein